MSATYVNISKTVSTQTVALFRAVDAATSNVGIPYFVVGATARDMILQHAFDLKVRRATRDVDVAIRVESWVQYDALASVLEQSGHFARSRPGHRFVFDGNELLDIIPFGRIGGESRVVRWPLEDGVQMQVLGFEEAFRSATLVRLSENPPLDVRAATLAGLVVMKLLAWDDRKEDRQRDAEDLNTILDSYADAGNDGRILSAAAGLMDESSDYVGAGARLLGRDVASIASGEARTRIEEILHREADRQGPLSLPLAMVRGDLAFSEGFDNALRLLDEFRKGLAETM